MPNQEIKITELLEPQPSELERIENLLRADAWTEPQIQGQLKLIKYITLHNEGTIFIATNGGTYIGFVSAQYYDWNHLAQVHGLVIDKLQRRKKIATQLMNSIEEYMRKKSARGVFVDTPVTNDAARAFYQTRGYQEDYIMTKYYDESTDGVAYLKLF